jgi:hypothetical protein
MTEAVDPRLVALLGSETRLRVLAVLASAYRPLTAYRVGKTGAVPLPKAYRELYRMEQAGLVARDGTGWTLLDRDVRSLLRKRVRIRWFEDLRAERDQNSRRRRATLRRLNSLTPPQFPVDWKPRDPNEVARDLRKDEILRGLGLRGSIHADQ